MHKNQIEMISINFWKPKLHFLKNIRKISVTTQKPRPCRDNEHTIASLCKQNRYKEALQTFETFINNNNNDTPTLNPTTYVQLICACSSLRSLQHGRRVHDHIKSSNAQQNIVLQNHIINMYGKCGSLVDARKAFDEMAQRNLVSWTSLIAGYSHNSHNIDAAELYREMVMSSFVPDEFTFGSVVKACSGLGDAGLGRQLHAHVVKSECGSSLIAQNALIAMYTKFDLVGDAWNVFSRMVVKDLISWGSMIAGFSQLDMEIDALSYFKEMLNQGIYEPNEFVFGSVISACSRLHRLDYGMQIHGMCIKFGLGSNKFAACSLCDMYSKCCSLDAAVKVFHQIQRPDVVSWNALISGFSNHGYSNESLLFFSQMRQMNLFPNEITVISLLSCFPHPISRQQGMQMHSYIIKTGLNAGVPVQNVLLTMYVKCSNLCEAFNAFEEMKDNGNLITWNSILAACMQHNQPTEAFRLFKLLLVSKMKPDYITLTTILTAYADMASLEMGKQVHCYTIKMGLFNDVSVANGLIDMYTKCGSLKIAENLFNSIENPDVVSWSCLIVGYAQFGYAEEAINLFRRMQSVGTKPNEVTMVGVLTACSHEGLVDEGWELYRTMKIKHGIEPTKEHRTCVVDMLARAGLLYEAKEFISQIPCGGDLVMWKALLAACKTCKNLEIAKWAAENILRLDPSNSAAYVLLCNICASSGSLEEVARLRSTLKDQSVRRVPGQSWIEVQNRIHAFLAADNLHPEREKIYAVMEELWLQLLDNGYVPFQDRQLGRQVLVGN